MTKPDAQERSARIRLWTGRIITGVVSAMFAMSGIMKLVGGKQLEEGMEHLGLPADIVIPLGILELTCVTIYLIPRTSMIGAILLAGYMGGAICTHWRVGDLFIVQIALGVLVWVGLWLREPRLWQLMPWRRIERANR